MSSTVHGIQKFLDRFDHSALNGDDPGRDLIGLVASEDFRRLLSTLVEAPAFSNALGEEFAAVGAVEGISACRMLRGCMNLSLRRFIMLLAQLLSSFDSAPEKPAVGPAWKRFAERIQQAEALRDEKLTEYAASLQNASDARIFYESLAVRLEQTNPHAIYPTSNYRESDGHAVSTADDQTIEAVMSVSTFSSIKIVDRSLDLDQRVLKDIYQSLGRCVCLVDESVEAIYGAQLERYFTHHDVVLHKRVYRAMEADKGIRTVEKMLGDFKALGVSRNEPVLIVGAGCWPTPADWLARSMAAIPPM